MDFKKIESKWQKRWEEKKAFQAKESPKKKYYVLEMYPYPSANGLHMGHAFQYTIGDILARFKRMNGFNVLYPMGYDSFGLPAENAAIKEQIHPKKYTDNAIKNFVKQQQALGLSYDWERTLSSHDIDYYKWNQNFFLEFLEKDLVYRKKSPVNWCKKCETVLANEQVHNGKCWRHNDTEVEIKHLEQWFIKTTKYADELLNEIDKLDWPEKIKTMQRNWIGRSEGTEVLFEINNENWPVFTTRVDTLFGVTFMVISAQHSRLTELVTKEQKSEVEKFLKKIKSTKQEDLDKLDKEGVFTGSYAIHPLTKEKIPIWAGNFVLADYGSGMVMADAHDQRDLEFAQKYKIPLIEVIRPEGAKPTDPNKAEKAFTGYGKLVNSKEFNGLTSLEAIEKILVALEQKKLGRKTISYKIRDWLISRQRYWGTPIPIIYCDKCGIVPVPKEELPIELPEKVKFGEGNPLATNEKFVNTKCPKCKSKARRETDTMDTFFDSSWYYLRFCDSKNKKEPFEKNKIEHWMPVDFYTGGTEHAVMHLIYARFFTKALRDLGYLKFSEPFAKLFNQGMLHGEDGMVMSKSRPEFNIDPLDTIKKYGADTLRLFLFSSTSPDKDSLWSSSGIESSAKFVNRILGHNSHIKFGKSNKKLEHKLNSAIKNISKYIEELKYNLAIINLRNLFEAFEEEISKEDYEKFLKILSLFCPHIAEELWEKTSGKGFISLSEWPQVDESKINEDFDKQEQIIEKTVSDILNILKIVKEKQNLSPDKIYLYVLPNELQNYNAKELSLRTNKEVIIFAVNDKSKYDPENKSSKAKFGKPAIFVE